MSAVSVRLVTLSPRPSFDATAVTAASVSVGGMGEPGQVQRPLRVPAGATTEGTPSAGCLAGWRRSLLVMLFESLFDPVGTVQQELVDEVEAPVSDRLFGVLSMESEDDPDDLSAVR